VRRPLVLVVLVICALAQAITVATTADASDDGASLLQPPGTRLGSGFRVAPGTRLVGAVFPKLDGYGNGTTGWKAVFVVRSDALHAMNAYAIQAAENGFRQVSNPRPHCSSPRDGEVFCKGLYVRAETILGIDVHVCRSCGHADTATWSVSEAQLDYSVTPNVPREWLEPISPPTALASGGAPPSSTPTVRLTDREYREMLRDPGKGAAHQGFDLRGSLLVAPATTFGNCQSDLVGVVSGPGLDRVISRSPQKPTVVGRSKVTQASNGTTTWTLVRSADLPRPVLLSDTCGD
jgi:hypothetical protein